MSPKKRAAEEASSPPAKKAPSPPAAPGAPPPPAPLNITELLETEVATTTRRSLQEWVRQVKGYVDQALLVFLEENKREVSFAVPAKCSLIPPLAVRQAASGANLSAFREVMDFENLGASFSWTGQYEAAGTVWMLDPICPDIDDVSVSQLEGAAIMWTE